METNQLIQELRGSDLESWMLVQRAYKTYAHGEDIMECGFNKMSGYVYIALENGVQIASCFGQDVDYIKYDFETSEEYFFDTYEESLNN
jgi:hypothetical protein|tara:strand:+ start:563 stop:829 length:267 start_codon:yes stop_codon:yes gene_type:complete